MYAGVAAAPVQVPTRRRGLERVRRIADDAGTGTILTTAAIKQDLEQRFGTVPELSGLTLVDAASLPASESDTAPRRPRPEDVALLQYTSGSTGHPKGVMVTHANFLSNVAETEELWPSGEDGVVVSWLPLFHDMGMLFGIVLPICSGVTAYLMEPTAFARRPLRWLEAISRFRGTHAAAPSFAYEQCVRAAEQADGIEALAQRLDLSSWRAAVNGAEPVRWKTVQAFLDTFAPAGFARRPCPSATDWPRTPSKPPAARRTGGPACSGSLARRCGKAASRSWTPRSQAPSPWSAAAARPPRPACAPSTPSPPAPARPAPSASCG
jgi:acyl-CoA synthetase (AMP-forming)/AMP-acid ligase II